MRQIHRLPEALANQIAAGEVVERPASVVKELVENSIDAGALRISVTIELGGKKLLRVDDDGAGMGPEDARVSIERHATSKIRRAEDLERIVTLGFRGEALPSIASVSRFLLRTRERGSHVGSEIRMSGGTLESVTEVGAPEGTTIEVADLFYNMPARRKFLKSDTAEATHVSRIITQLALCYPEIGFSLTSGSRVLLQCPPVGSLRERLYQLYGERTDLVGVHRDSGDVKIEGYVAALAEQGPVRGPQNIFVNRRVVKDRTIAHAIIESYSVASIKERSPEVHLFIEMPREAVDVNVHPTKAEVRFRDQSYMHQVVRRTLGDALGRGSAPELQLEPAHQGSSIPTTLPLPHAYASVYPSRWTVGAPPAPTSVGGLAPTSVSGVAPAGDRPFAPTSDSGLAPTIDSGIAPANVRTLIPLGQFRDTFIVAVDEEGIAIIDQHVAHERVLFERMVARLTEGRLESQRLLEPLLLELSAGGRQALLSHGADLERLGFEMEEFGGGVVRVLAVPAVLGLEACGTAIRVLADDLENLDRGAGLEEAVRRIAATMACHAAVKANYPLTHEKMVHLLEELRKTAYSTICPHGRPVMLRLTRREVEKNFQRV